MAELDQKSHQTALAIGAVAVAFARTLERLSPDEEPLVTLQREMKAGLTYLHSHHDSELALAIFRIVQDTLRDPTAVDQSRDDD